MLILKIRLLVLPLLIQLSLQQVYYSAGTTNNTVVEVCHCDLTKGFCDWNCCCDKECSSAVTSELASKKQTCTTNSYRTYCLDKAYYASIKVTPIATVTSGSLTCYEFNNTNEAQAEVSISAQQVSELTKSTTPYSSQTYAQGYSITTQLFSTTKLLEVDGKCSLSTAAPGPVNTVVYFGRNLTLTCQATQTATCESNNIRLFQNILSASFASEYLGSSLLQLAPLKASCVSTLTVLIFYSSWGAAATPQPYILSIKNIEESSATNPSTYTLKLRFIDVASQASSSSTLPPFFPKIPADMFYPIFYKSAVALNLLLIGYIVLL